MYDRAVETTETICRFILDKNYFRKADLGVKHNAFMPAKNGEVSVYRIDGLERSELEEIGSNYVAKPRGKPLIGFANVKAEVPLANGLRGLGTKEPHSRHANITNWPGGSADKLIAIKIAEAARLELITH